MSKKTPTLPKTFSVYLIFAWQVEKGVYKLKLMGWSDKSAKDAWDNYDDWGLESFDNIPVIPFLLTFSIDSGNLLTPELMRAFVNPDFVVNTELSENYQKKLNALRNKLEKTPAVITAAFENEQTPTKMATKKTPAKKPATKKAAPTKKPSPKKAK